MNFGRLFRQEQKIPETEKEYEDFFDFEKGQGKTPNIIFLFSESLSAADSKKA
ncbi:hypothetical protein IJM86_01435 [bacterium]|nr:hypothetical protein [bacterium]